MGVGIRSPPARSNRVGGGRSVEADENGYRFHSHQSHSRSLRSLAWKWLSFSNWVERVRSTSGETGEISGTDETGCPSVAVLNVTQC